MSIVPKHVQFSCYLGISNMSRFGKQLYRDTYHQLYCWYRFRTLNDYWEPYYICDHFMMWSERKWTRGYTGTGEAGKLATWTSYLEQVERLLDQFTNIAEIASKHRLLDPAARLAVHRAGSLYGTKKPTKWTETSGSPSLSLDYIWAISNCTLFCQPYASGQSRRQGRLAWP